MCTASRQTILYCAGELDLPEPEGVRRRMEETKAAMNRLMRDDDGFYYDLHAGTDTKVSVRTLGGLFPLLTDIPDPVTRRGLIDSYLMNETEFLSACPPTTVAMSDPSYGSADFWRGANWPQTTWSILYGIYRDRPDAAAEILSRFLSRTAPSGNCFEYYDSQTGTGAGMPFQGWGTLYIDLIARFLCGITPTEHGFRCAPLPTTDGAVHTLRGVSVRGLTVDVEVRREHSVVNAPRMGLNHHTAAAPRGRHHPGRRRRASRDDHDHLRGRPAHR